MARARQSRRRSRLAVLAAGALAAAALASGPPAAEAVIAPAQVLDGPRGEIVEVGGAALASDGTGGVVYLKRFGDHTRVFVSRYLRGRWSAPIQVDGDLPFDSSWPQIAAGAGGRLVVVFAHAMEQGNLWLFGATLEPGTGAFSAPIEIDADLAGADGLYPELAMNDAGRAYLAYRVPRPGTTVRNGDVLAETRVARLSGRRWSRIGQVNRRPGISTRPPTAENAPKVAIDVEGNGLVAFQEPDDELIDRLWARRLFGSTAGRILAVGPTTWDGQPLRGEVDAFSVGGAGFGTAAVAFRQQPGPTSPLRGPRVMVNAIPVSLDEKSAEFRGARLADGAGAGVPPGIPSLPTVAVDPEERLRVAFTAGDRVLVTGGELGAISSGFTLAAPRGGPAGAPGVALGDSGALAVAWPVTDGAGGGAVTLQERPAHGSASTALLSGPVAGAISDMRTGSSGLGDALVAFRQGAGPTTQVVAATLDAPPSDFELNVPDGWVRPARGRITWTPAREAHGHPRYQPVLDGHRIARQVTARSYRFDRRRLGDGTHRIQVIARDTAGQTTPSSAARLRVDGTAPRATISVRGRKLTVRVSDGPRRRGSGVRPGRTTVTFGDGKRVRRRGSKARHTYRRGGRFRVVVTARDRAGNAARVVRTVRVG